MEGDLEKQMEYLYNLIDKVNEQNIQIWLNHVLFTWQWWFGVILSIVPWILWILWRKKESTYRLLCAGFFAMLLSSWLDDIGSETGTWHYYYEVLPYIPAYEPWDFTLMPVGIMFFLQYKPHISPYLKAAVFAGIAAFVAEPLFAAIGLYNREHWKHIYSFPIYATIYLAAHYISTREQFARLQQGGTKQ